MSTTPTPSVELWSSARSNSGVSREPGSGGKCLQEEAQKQYSSSPQASLASLPLPPVSEKAVRMTVGSGQRLSAWLPEQGPIGVFLKTLLESPVWTNPLRSLEWRLKGYGTVPDEPSLKSSADLPLLDMSCLATGTGFPGFRLCRLLVSEHGTGETGYSSCADDLWGTPEATEAPCSRSHKTDAAGLSNQVKAHAQLWATAQQFLRQAEDEKRDLFSAPRDQTLFDLPCAIQ